LCRRRGTFYATWSGKSRRVRRTTTTTIITQAGLEKTRVFFNKNPAQWVFFCFVFGFLGFLGFFYIFAQNREFLGFFQFQEYF
jgi:hypothetical protein